MVLYSHSKLSTFEQCKLKYKFKYIDKIPEVKKYIEAFLGKIVHLTFEWLYSEVKNGKLPTLDEVIIYYSGKWHERISPDFIIVKNHLTDKDYFEMGIKFIIGYYMKHQPFDDNSLALEKRIHLKLGKENEHNVVGFIDRLVHNLKKDRYEIHDYKTSNYFPEQEKMDNDRQLALYSIGIKNEFGRDKKVKLIWHYLAHNQEIHSERTDEQLEQLKIDSCTLIKAIELTSEFPPNKSVLCDWCEYKDICPA